MTNIKIVEIQREMGEHDAEIGIFEEPNGVICLAVAQIDGANKDCTAAKIARALVAIAADVTIDAPQRYIPGDDVQPTSNPTSTIH
jgi:hypothetical protein